MTYSFDVKARHWDDVLNLFIHTYSFSIILKNAKVS